MNELLFIASTFTAEPIELTLRSWIRWLEQNREIKFAPFNQIFQQLLDPNSALSTNQNGTNVLLLRLEDWAFPNDPQAVARNTTEFLEAIRAFAVRTTSRLIIVLCPNSPDLSPEILRELAQTETRLVEQLASQPPVQLISDFSRYRVDEVFDPLAAKAAHVPYTPQFYSALATTLVRRLRGLERPPVKVVVLDCDQTLWDGVCGEDGVRGIAVSERRCELQDRLLQLRDQGKLLCLCSKNSESDVWEVFEQHSAMRLRREHITASRINWLSKSQNIKSLAEQLRLGLDSFVFIDDSPVECAEVRANCPEVLTLQLPDTGSLNEFVDHVWDFDQATVTQADRQRAQLYQQESHREQLRAATPTLEQFLANLELELEFLPITAERLERVSQLTHRTNQFNFTTVRRSPSEIQQFCEAPNHGAFVVQAKDRFGDYGLIGLAMYQTQASHLTVDSFLLSCRALGRGIESKMLARIAEIAAGDHLEYVSIALVPSNKNQPARDFLNTQLGNFARSTSNEIVYSLTVNQLQVIANQVVVWQQPTVQTTQSSVLSTIAAQPSAFLSEVACQLRDVDSILQKIRSEARTRPESDEPFVSPRNDIERAVTTICQQVLNLDSVGVRDGLKALGASSLHIVQIYSQLERQLAAGITITELFALPTIADVVARIEGPAPTHRAFSSQENFKAKELSLPTDQSRATNQGFAVIGMSGRFPGAMDVREFWKNLTQGVCSIVDIPESELNLPLDSPLRKNPNLVRRGASVKDADKFDAKFFGIFPKEATVMDPQHRILLECCWHAIEDAGYNVDNLDVPVGVFAGCYMDTYILSALTTNPGLIDSLANAFHGGDLLTELGNDKDYLATRVSFLLNLTGPAITIGTACSTSLVAIVQACQSLASGHCDMALAGGSTLKLPQNRGYLYTEGGMVSPDGVCRTFDAKARGTVFGEGCGVVLLKRVEDALRDGDDVYAVIIGCGLNNDGRAKVGYTAPSVAGQMGAIEMAHRQAKISADTITYMEAHGTGTSLGDPIEIDSLSRVFRQTTDKQQYCAIGSLKTNVGHLDVAAGAAGLIKTSLALRNRVIPPSLNFEQANPNIDFEASPFFVNTQLRPWESAQPRRAGLSSFGVGGTNAHIVIEEAPQPRTTTKAAGPHLLTLSARSAEALDNATQQLVEHLRDNPQLDLADVAYTLQIGRKTFNYTRILAAKDVNDAIESFSKPNPQRVFSHKQIRRGQAVAFLFPGQGSQHINMARGLYEQDVVFRSHLDQCIELLKPHLGFDLRDKIFVDRDDQTAAAELSQTSVAQTSIFSISYSLAKCYESLGIKPQRMVGHSVGEFVAACLAGVFTLEDALRLVAFRGSQMQQLPRGTMIAVRATEQELRTRLPSEVALAAINGPQLCVISGPTESIHDFQRQLEAEEVVCRPLHTSHAFHSAMMDPVVRPFAELLKTIRLSPPNIPIISSVTGKQLTDEQAVAHDYWATHLRETVRFTDAIASLCQQSDEILLEVGPGQVVGTLARQHPSRQAEQTVLSSLPHATQAVSANEHFLISLGRLWQNGVEVHWENLPQNERRLRVHLPGYPFERQRYWYETNLTSLTSNHVFEESELADSDLEASELEVASKVVSQSNGTAAEIVVKPLQASDTDQIDSVTQAVVKQQLELMRQQLEAFQAINRQ